MGLLRRSKQTDHVIDLTALERKAPATPIQFGLPTSCPECGHSGYLDHIDPFREVMYQHCPSCWHKWELSRSEVETSANA
jgi:uncharacterized protein (DUF983 family)